MKKENYPLLIIDSSRKHLRGVETDYLVCTSSVSGFIAHTELYNKSEFVKIFELLKNNRLCAFVQPNANGVGMVLRIDKLFNEKISDGDLRRIKARAIKEYIARTQREIDYTEPTDEQILNYLETMVKTGEDYLLNPSKTEVEPALLLLQINICKSLYFRILNKQLNK